ncbi:hypothetical protein L6V77_08205 [Myxococcota bacterium]|nr:hypothetical protein [Myxococcota bacterium]
MPPTLVCRTVSTVVLAGLAALVPRPVAAQQSCNAQPDLEGKLTCIFQRQIAPLVNDLDQILIEGPKYLAQRLPPLQAMGDLGGQMDLETPNAFSVSLGVTSGVYFDFNQEVADDFQRLPKTLPEPLPLPSAVLSARYGVTPDWELTGRFGYVPEFKTKSRDWEIAAATRTFALGTRYRLSRGEGSWPTLVSSAEVSYFTGYMEVGRGLTYPLITMREAAKLADVPWEPVRTAINDEFREANGGTDILGPADDVTIGTFFRGAPILGWDIYQLSLEQRAAWALGFFHPVLGLGLDAAQGHVDSGVQLEIDLRVTRPRHFVDVAGNFKEPVLPDQDVTLETEDPRRFGARLIAGFEFDLGDHFRLPFEAQYDLGSGALLGGFALRFAWR